MGLVCLNNVAIVCLGACFCDTGDPILQNEVSSWIRLSSQ